MQRKVLQVLAIVFLAYPVVGLAQAPKDGIYFTAEDIQAVLKHAADTKRTIPDNTIQVLDMGKYNLGVAVVTAVRWRPRRGRFARRPPPQRRAISAACGEQVTAQRSRRHYHDDTADSYM